MKSLLKKLYKSLPCKKAVYSLLRKIWIPPHRIYKHLYFFEPFQVSGFGVNFKLQHHGYEIDNEIFWKGLEKGWEATSLSLWVKLARNAKVIFDVGAFGGLYALLAQASNPAASVFLFEAEPGHFREAMENVRLNNFNIQGIEAAVSNKPGELYFHNWSIVKEPGPGVKSVKAVCLADVMEEYDLTSLDLLKIDVEGAEPLVLQGLGDYLDRFRPTLLIEVLSDQAGEALQPFFENKGYLYFNIDDQLGTVRQVPRLGKSDYYNFLVCSQERASELNLVKHIPGVTA